MLHERFVEREHPIDCHILNTQAGCISRNNVYDQACLDPD